MPGQAVKVLGTLVATETRPASMGSSGSSDGNLNILGGALGGGGLLCYVFDIWMLT